jgi:hypothetical protein
MIIALLENLETTYLVIVGVIIIYNLIDNNTPGFLGVIGIVVAIVYFTVTDFACYVNETIKPVELCTEWYAKEAYNAAKEEDADEFKDIMHNWNEWIETLDDAQLKRMAYTLSSWAREHKYKCSVMYKFENKLNLSSKIDFHEDYATSPL